MMENIKYFLIILILFSGINCCSLADEYPESTGYKYPDYSCMYLGEDKCENFNRKMFNFNLKLNKFLVRPVHIIWASVVPKYGMDRIKGVYTNIEYPRRLVSTLLQKDFKSSGTETLRFLTNSTIGLGGMFDPAKRLFHIEPVDEDMEQALSKCKCNSGSYLVLPGLPATTPRGIAGEALDIALNPSSYIATPIIALVKLGFTINQTNEYEPIAELIESTYADPYDIAKKLYGIERYIKRHNYDRKEVLRKKTEDLNPDQVELVDNSLNFESKSPEETLQALLAITGLLNSEKKQNGVQISEEKIKPDIILSDYKPQTPVIDAMRTALFDVPDLEDSIWGDFSIWNRCFRNRLKTDEIKICEGKDNYKFKYIMQKKKNSPVAIIYPSIGEGIMSHNSLVMAKIFYDEGYSVIIQGSHFQWEFVKSMPDGYYPGIPSVDVSYLRDVTGRILDMLQKKYDCTFQEKVLIGTSFGALETLFVANVENKCNTMNLTKYISINPPIELLYAMKQFDKNNEEWQKNPNDLQDRVAVTAANVLNLLKEAENPHFKFDQFPFSDSEAKLITGFVMHQKLSDLVFTLEKIPKNKKTDIYKQINNMSYEDYMNKYVLANSNTSYYDLNYDTSLYSISDFLMQNNNYKIFHTLDDYLVNTSQLVRLKKYARENAIYLNNGSHLGYLYRPEFINALRKEISIENIRAQLISKNN